jgi:hypothetical protein
MDLYILINNIPIAVSDYRTWSEWMSKNNKDIAKSTIDDYFISTIFLGINHNFFDEENPILFESMVFEHQEPIGCRRYTTWSEAKQGHEDFVTKYTELKEKSIQMAKDLLEQFIN